jgi:2-polyprenyl-3-methyl-5-hydroxy-6-metoxy-1,4-benzoquinol methylase
MQQQKQEWFATWFDSEYYHLLYNNRSEEEAQEFIQKLAAQLQLPAHAAVLDLACGKGRHSRTLQQLGYDTTGVDLSPQSIAYAQQYQADTLHFAVHDMRNVLAVNYFDAVLNLFTSFGYMQTQHQNQQVATAMYAAAKPGALLVIDFLNAHKLLQQFATPVNYTEQRGDVCFNITKFVKDGRIFKQIQITENNAELGTFQEQVQLLQLADFVQLFNGKAKLLAHYGSYNLSPYSAMESDRLIMIFQKDK